MEAVVLFSGGTQRFFASANTAKGFLNYYDGVFFSVPRVWYIKGGPGTGKSYMMRKIAAAGRERGLTTLLYHCSSDPESLDGVLLPEIGFGILDSTPPHASEPRYPGAGDRLVDVGRFWNETILRSRREEISHLIAKKQAAYKAAYAGLAAEASLRQAVRILLEPALLREKMVRVAERICKQGGVEQAFVRQDCLTDAIGMGGRVHVATLEEAASQVYVVRGATCVGEAFLDALVDAASKGKHSVVCALDPLDPKRLRSVLLTQTGTLYTLTPTSAPAKEMNVTRFLAKDVLSGMRARLRKLVKAERTAREATDHGFMQIRDLHFALERIYAEAMDFEKESAFLEKMIGEIF